MNTVRGSSTKRASGGWRPCCSRATRRGDSSPTTSSTTRRSSSLSARAGRPMQSWTARTPVGGTTRRGPEGSGLVANSASRARSAAAVGLRGHGCGRGRGIGRPLAGIGWPRRWPSVPSGKGPVANVAWLVNAQDCLWSQDGERPGRNMLAGKSLRLMRGLAEIEFDCGARVILQGPAGLELLSGGSARLLQGKLTAQRAGPCPGVYRPHAA